MNEPLKAGEGSMGTALPSNAYALKDFHNTYALKDSHKEVPDQVICFYEMGEEDEEGNAKTPTQNGTTLEEMLRVTHARLTDLNSRFACPENFEALAGIEVAQEALEARTKDRTERKVEGKHEA